MIGSAVELREIQAFLVLAEELHFSRSAERLGMSPSRVSQLLRALEGKVGFQLVHRTSRRVELTARGERFRGEVGAIYGELVTVLDRTQEESAVLNGTLRVGLLTPVVEGPRMPEIIATFSRRHPECRVELPRLPYGEAFEALGRGEVNVLASWLPHGQSSLVVGPTLTRAQRVLAVGEDHPLAGRSQVTVEDLGDYQTLPIEEVLSKELAEAWNPRRTPQGRIIRRLRMPFGQLARSDPGQLRNLMSWLIRTGEAVHPTTAGVKTILGPGIIYVPIADMPPLCSALVWPRGTTDPRRREFVRVAREILRADSAS